MQHIFSAWASCSCLYWIAFYYFKLLFCQDYFEFYCCLPRHLHAFLSLVSYVYIVYSSIHAIHTEDSAWHLQIIEADLTRAVNRTAKEKKRNMVNKASISLGKRIQAEKESKQAYIGLCCIKMYVWILLSLNKMILSNCDPFFCLFS